MTNETVKLILFVLLVVGVIVGLIFAMITHFGQVKLKDFQKVEQGKKPSLLTGQRYITNHNVPRGTQYYTAQAHCDLEQKHCNSEKLEQKHCNSELEVMQGHNKMPEPLSCNDCFSRKHTHY